MSHNNATLCIDGIKINGIHFLTTILATLCIIQLNGFQPRHAQLTGVY
jgi:hypothetical protein